MKFHARRTCLAVAVSGLALASGAYAGEDKMQMMDTNKDGMISAAEHTAGAKARFGKLDADGDGRVTAAEMDTAHSGAGAGGSAAPTMSSADKIKAIDTDGDGALTAAEHEKGSRGMFTKMDANGDGNLSAEEMQVGHHQKPMTEQPR